MMIRNPEAKYEAIGAAYARWRSTEYDPASYRPLLDQVPVPCRLAVDAGCGAGLLLGILAERCERVLGLDPSWTMLRLARDHLAARGTANAWLVRADASHLPLRDGGIDFLLMVHALHHTDSVRTLPALRRALAPGGRLAIRALVVRFRRLAAWPPVKAVYSVLRIVSIARRHGLRPAAANARFLLHPRWLTGTGRPKPTVEELTAQCQQALPGSRIERSGSGGAVTVLWPAPTTPTSGQP